jgi:hypothetical protein
MELKAALEQSPALLTEEEIHRLKQLNKLFTPVCPDAFLLGLEVVAALHWECYPFALDGCDEYPLTMKDRKPDQPFPPPAQVIHQHPFPTFPFLGFAQLWQGELLSVAVDRDIDSNMLLVVTLAGNEPFYDGRMDMYGFSRFSVLLVPDRYFRLTTEAEAKQPISYSEEELMHEWYGRWKEKYESG